MRCILQKRLVIVRLLTIVQLAYNYNRSHPTGARKVLTTWECTYDYHALEYTRLCDTLPTPVCSHTLPPHTTCRAQHSITLQKVSKYHFRTVLILKYISFLHIDSQMHLFSAYYTSPSFTSQNCFKSGLSV